MTKKTILFIGLMVCFLGVLAYVETLEKQKQEELGQADIKQTEISESSLQEETGETTWEHEKQKRSVLDELSVEKENSLIPLVSLEEWEASGPFANPENCEENKFFPNMRPAYCSLNGLKDSYSVFWKKNIQPKEKSFMLGTIVVSVFEFADEDSIVLEDVVSAHNAPYKSLQNFELNGTTIQRQEFEYGIRLVSLEEAETLSEQEIEDKTIAIVSYFDIFVLENFVFAVYYDSGYENEAKIIEKAIINN